MNIQLTPDSVSLPKRTVEELLEILEEHVQDFPCVPEIDLCFCEERRLMRDLKNALEHASYQTKHA